MNILYHLSLVHVDVWLKQNFAEATIFNLFAPTYDDVISPPRVCTYLFFFSNMFNLEYKPVELMAMARQSL